MRGSEVPPGSLLAAVGLEWDPQEREGEDKKKEQGQEREFGTGPQSLPPSPCPCGGIWAVFGTSTDLSKALDTLP